MTAICVYLCIYSLIDSRMYICSLSATIVVLSWNFDVFAVHHLTEMCAAMAQGHSLHVAFNLYERKHCMLHFIFSIARRDRQIQNISTHMHIKRTTCQFVVSKFLMQKLFRTLIHMYIHTYLYICLSVNRFYR